MTTRTDERAPPPNPSSLPKPVRRGGIHRMRTAQTGTYLDCIIVLSAEGLDIDENNTCFLHCLLTNEVGLRIRLSRSLAWLHG